MAVTNTPIYPQTVQNWITQFANADGTTPKSIIAAGTNGSKVESLLAFSTDTSARDVVIGIYNGTTNYLLTTISVPAGAGNTDTVPAVDLLRNVQWPTLSQDAMGNRYLYLKSGYSLYIGMGGTITSGKVVNIFGQGGDY